LTILAFAGAAVGALAFTGLVFAFVFALAGAALGAGFLADLVTAAPRALLAAALAGLRLISLTDFADLEPRAGDEFLFFLRAAIFVHSKSDICACLQCGVV